jgi:hypothetical protein
LTGAFDRHNQVGDCVFPHRNSDLVDGRMKRELIVFDFGRRDMDISIKVGEHPLGSCFGTVDADNPKMLGPHFLHSGMNNPMRFLQDIELLGPRLCRPSGPFETGNCSHLDFLLKRDVFISEDASGNTLGGSAPGAGNVIASNGDDGILVVSGTGNAILSNFIFSNDGLGIDLDEDGDAATDDGVTPNDSGDGDPGANKLQNFPVLTASTNSAGTTTLQGTLNSTANTVFTLEFFSNAASDPTGFGEAATFVGSVTVTTDDNGDANFTVVLTMAVPTGHFITATATDPNQNTSEFSQAVAVLT